MPANPGRTGERPQPPGGSLAWTLGPRVLILLGGNALSPEEFYELDLSRLVPNSVDPSLITAACSSTHGHHRYGTGSPRLWRRLVLTQAQLQSAQPGPQIGCDPIPWLTRHPSYSLGGLHLVPGTRDTEGLPRVNGNAHREHSG
eukprot:bmy_08248T0